MKVERKYWPIWVLIFAMFCAWGAWGMVLNKISPFASPEIAVPLFYLASFFAISLTFFSFDILFRLSFFPNIIVLKHTYASLRQGGLFGCMFLGLMIFQQFQILSWWIAGMIGIAGLFIEAFFWNR
jgi:hypothetical protein